MGPWGYREGQDAGHPEGIPRWLLDPGHDAFAHDPEAGKVLAEMKPFVAVGGAAGEA